MHELVYHSIASPKISSVDINAILTTARKHNSTHGLTGCLLFYRGEFLQVLEGEEKEINLLFERIKRDQRHSSVRVLYEGDKEKRTFNHWNMAHLDLQEDHISTFKKGLFIDNFIALSDMIGATSEAISIFWSISLAILSKDAELEGISE